MATISATVVASTFGARPVLTVLTAEVSSANWYFEDGIKIEVAEKNARVILHFFYAYSTIKKENINKLKEKKYEI